MKWVTLHKYRTVLKPKENFSFVESSLFWTRFIFLLEQSKFVFGQWTNYLENFHFVTRGYPSLSANWKRGMLTEKEVLELSWIQSISLGSYLKLKLLYVTESLDAPCMLLHWLELCAPYYLVVRTVCHHHSSECHHIQQQLCTTTLVYDNSNEPENVVANWPMVKFWRSAC